MKIGVIISQPSYIYGKNPIINIKETIPNGTTIAVRSIFVEHNDSLENPYAITTGVAEYIYDNTKKGLK